MAPMTQSAEVAKKGTSQPKSRTRYASRAGEIAPPMLPHMFMTEAVQPAKSPPMSSGMAQETPTVSSKPPKARQLKATQSFGSCVRGAGGNSRAAAADARTAKMGRGEGCGAG